jgi:hypothetical protein
VRSLEMPSCLMAAILPVPTPRRTARREPAAGGRTPYGDWRSTMACSASSSSLSNQKRSHMLQKSTSIA